MKYTRTTQRLLILLLIASSHLVRAQENNELAAFEHRASLSKELGLTHVVITADLPPALWQLDPPGDPYPAWFINQPAIMKIFPPKEVQPFVSMQYAERVQKILVERCAILRKYGLKAQWSCNEPQVLPEAFFTAFPNLRGPRVDQSNRSRVARFAPCVDEPQTLQMYRAAMKDLLTALPEVDSFSFLTQDSGSGFDWVPSLYPGINGNSNYKDRPIEQRVSSFLINLQQAAKDAGHDITINLNPIGPRQWMTPSFSPTVLDAMVKLLPRGVAVQGHEGPDGRPFAGTGGGGTGGAFYPVVGIYVPNLTGGRGGALGDDASLDFSYRLLKATRSAPARNMIERLQSLRTFAVTEVGEDRADDLLDAWNSLSEVERGLNALNFGGMLRFGHVLNRWITRPMVPFPNELTDEEKKHYRPFLFQAKGEEEADNLVDIQAMRMYEGWGAKMLFQRVIETNAPLMRSAINRVERIRDSARDDAAKKQWDLLSKRLDAVLCLLHSADNMVAFQAHLDRVKELEIKPEPNPVLGVQSDWARTDMLETARKEIDNMVHLREILQSTSEPILDAAPTPEEENIMRLGPTVADQIKRKIDIMNAHWRDYDKIFTQPNP